MPKGQEVGPQSRQNIAAPTRRESTKTPGKKSSQAQAQAVLRHVNGREEGSVCPRSPPADWAYSSMTRGRL